MTTRSSLFAVAALTAASALALAACSSDPGSGGAQSDPATGDGGALTTVTDGTLTVCSDIPYEPFEYLDGDKTVGFDIDITQAIADDLGLELQVIDSSFDAITSGLFKTQCDIAASSISITDERKQNVDFSDPYYDDDLVLVAKTGSGVTSLESAKGQSVGVQAATTGEAYGKENGIDTIGYEDSGLQIQSLVSGQTVASLGNQSVLRYAIKDRPDFEVVQEIQTGEKLGIAVPKGATALLDAVNSTLGELESSGQLEELKQKWFDGE